MLCPTYAHLLTKRLRFKDIPGRVKVAAALGAPYEDGVAENAIELAKLQAEQIRTELVEQGGPAQVDLGNGKVIPVEETQVIAMIAYMQRVGIDLFADPNAEDTPADEAKPGRCKPGRSKLGRCGIFGR